MANTRRITEVLQQIGYEPQEGKTIVVSYAPENLSDAIRKIFILNNFYALSFCKEQLVLIPYRHFWADVKKEVNSCASCLYRTSPPDCTFPNCGVQTALPAARTAQSLHPQA